MEIIEKFIFWWYMNKTLKYIILWVVLFILCVVYSSRKVVRWSLDSPFSQSVLIRSYKSPLLWYTYKIESNVVDIVLHNHCDVHIFHKEWFMEHWYLSPILHDLNEFMIKWPLWKNKTIYVNLNKSKFISTTISVTTSDDAELGIPLEKDSCNAISCFWAIIETTLYESLWFFPYQWERIMTYYACAD